MGFQAIIEDCFAMSNGTALIVHSLVGEMRQGDRVSLDGTTSILIGFAGDDWNPRTHACLTGQRLERPQWAFMIDSKVPTESMSSLRGTPIVTVDGA